MLLFQEGDRFSFSLYSWRRCLSLFVCFWVNDISGSGQERWRCLIAWTECIYIFIHALSQPLEIRFVHCCGRGAWITPQPPVCFFSPLLVARHSGTLATTDCGEIVERLWHRVGMLLPTLCVSRMSGSMTILSDHGQRVAHVGIACGLQDLGAAVEDCSELQER